MEVREAQRIRLRPHHMDAAGITHLRDQQIIYKQPLTTPKSILSMRDGFTLRSDAAISSIEDLIIPDSLAVCGGSTRKLGAGD